MADSDKNIIITPNRGATSQPTIAFTGQGNDPITLRVLDGTTGAGLTAGGALSFEGSAGQLFSVVNRLGTGSIFSVNDISGMPSIDVDANGTIELAPFTGYVAIGLTAPTEKLHVVGNILSSGSVNAFGGVSAAGGTFASDIVVNGVRVGEGGGSITTNVAVGHSVLNANTTGSRNTSIGYNSMLLNTVGYYNTAVGYLTLSGNTEGYGNVALGHAALSVHRGQETTAVGYNALAYNTTGINNTAIGFETLSNGSTCSFNTAVGYKALQLNLGDSNTSVGVWALDANTTGIRNTAVGDRALTDQTTGSNNTAIGYGAISSNSTGLYNTAVGDQASTTGTTASNTTAVGYRALYLNTQSNNTAVGSESLDANTTGDANTAVGYRSLTANTTGIYNTALGAYALRDNTTGEYNTSVGFESSRNGTTGSYNTNVGAYAGWLASGNENTLIGSFALGGGATSGTSRAVVIGTEALYPTYNATNTVAIGYRAGRFYAGVNNVRTAENSIFLGPSTRPNNDNQTNQIVIGFNTDGDGSNTTVIGNSSTTSTRVFGTFITNGGVSASGGTFAGIVNFLGGMCVASGITLTAAAGTRTHLSQGGIRGANFKIRNQVSFGLGAGDANEFDIGPSGGNITIAPTTSTVTIDTGLQNKSSVDYQTGIRFLGYNNMLSTSYNTLLQVGFGSGNTLSLPSTSGTLALTNDVVTRFNGLTGQVTGVTTGNANTFGPLQSFTNGISAAGGVTFNTPIVSTRLPRHTSSIFETKTADFSPAEADNGKIFIVTVTGKGTVTITLDGLSVGWRAKFLCVDSGQVNFTSSLGTVVGRYGFNTVDYEGPIVEVICYGTDLYYAG